MELIAARLGCTDEVTKYMAVCRELLLLDPRALPRTLTSGRHPIRVAPTGYALAGRCPQVQAPSAHHAKVVRAHLGAHHQRRRARARTLGAHGERARFPAPRQRRLLFWRRRGGDHSFRAQRQQLRHVLLGVINVATPPRLHPCGGYLLDTFLFSRVGRHTLASSERAGGQLSRRRAHAQAEAHRPRLVAGRLRFSPGLLKAVVQMLQRNGLGQLVAHAAMVKVCRLARHRLVAPGVSPPRALERVGQRARIVRQQLEEI
mmetsp:Transcript_14035/g.29695  ORF Transcript_14035/g.29695 Transcript_14035/m.29695 type:complete len:260 (-) Transcript_14035:351-1130(-)